MTRFRGQLALASSLLLAACNEPTAPIPVFQTPPPISASTAPVLGCFSEFTAMMTAGGQVTLATTALALAVKQGNKALADILKKQLALAYADFAAASASYWACATAPTGGMGGGGGLTCTLVHHSPIYNGAGVLVQEAYDEWVCQ